MNQNETFTPVIYFAMSLLTLGFVCSLMSGVMKLMAGSSSSPRLDQPAHTPVGNIETAELKASTEIPPWGAIGFASPEVEAKVRFASGLIEFVDSELRGLWLKYGTAPKKVNFIETVSPLAMIIFNEVQIGSAFADLWMADRRSTEEALRYIIAHEFGHYMMTVGRVKIPLPKGLKWRVERVVWKENYAHEFAERETGISRSQIDGLMDRLEEARGEWHWLI